MKHLTGYIDFISPYAYLAFETLPDALARLDYTITWRPVLFAGILKHHGQLGPAEIAGKRDWTYRQVLWHARTHGIPLDMPRAHPFNPLGLLRLALACSPDGAPSRPVCEAIFRHVWRGGAAGDDPERLAHLTRALAPARDPGDESVKAALRANTAEAIEAGVFGVPSFVVDRQVFWGFDALPMLKACLQSDPFFAQQWHHTDRVAPGIERKR